ncbi:glycosyltransferase [Desulfitobacterium metallireducens]|uniref:Glycosyl transferase n=1 Tax=Desulfitobacterium metallireducens DSM 15288 TaxID=871968 RepID=W0EB30_9FIRM|nr:glycosyltransferase [Desulfitobacterium metallireducens]AHF08075.1 glycosyl transferase [Desulfitobacterium metallireducens DSM 15288]
MKLLLTVHQFFPDYFSGTEVLTFSVAKELLRRGHQVFVLTGFPAKQVIPDVERFDEYDIEGIHVYRFYHSFVPMGDQQVLSEVEYNNHLVASYFVRIIKEIEPDIVHFFHFSRLGTALIDVVKQYGIPAFYTPTDFWAVCPTSQLLLGEGMVCQGPTQNGGNCVKHVAMQTGWKKIASVIRYIPTSAIDAIDSVAKLHLPISFPFKKEIAALSQRKPFNVSRLNALHGIVSPTQLMTKVLVENGVNQKLITQSAYGINIASFNSEPRSYDAQSRITFAFIGTLAPHKGCHVLVNAFSDLNSENARLKIYGNTTDFPDYVTELNQVVENNTNIEFCGTFPNSQIAEIISGIDVLVVPSVWYENTPLVVYSALAGKCPVIASNFPGMSEVISDDWNGLLFKPGDVQMLRACISKLLNAPDLLMKLSRNCERPKSINAYVDELLQLYAQEPIIGENSSFRWQKFESLNTSSANGYITGWAVASSSNPMSIRVYDGDREVGVTTQFLSRQDVRDGFQKTGFNVNTDRLGFTINFTFPVSQSAVILEIKDHCEKTHRLKIARLNAGSSIQYGAREFIGIDQVNFLQDPVEA